MNISLERTKHIRSVGNFCLTSHTFLSCRRVATDIHIFYREKTILLPSGTACRSRDNISKYFEVLSSKAVIRELAETHGVNKIKTE
jgi:hypothetical protein